MSNVVSNYKYNITGLDQTVRKTNNFLRFVNAFRLSIKDIQDVLKAPTLANFMWTLIQLTRTYTALKRLMKSIESESSALLSGSQAALLGITPNLGPQHVSNQFISSLNAIQLNVTAKMNDVPIGMERLDLSTYPDRLNILLQRNVEAEAEQTADEAKRLLRERILHPEDSTGFLESTIGWTPTNPGATVFADAFYSFWVEEGQRSFTGHHFLRDATEAGRIRLSERLREEIDTLIKGSNPLI